MFTFSFIAWVFLAVVFIICFTVLVILSKRTRDKVISEEKSPGWKYSAFYIFIGIYMFRLNYTHIKIGKKPTDYSVVKSSII